MKERGLVGVLCMAGLIICISGCASSRSYMPSRFSQSTGVYSIDDTSYKGMIQQARFFCPYGYQTIDINHDDSFSWHTTINCKHPPQSAVEDSATHSGNMNP